MAHRSRKPKTKSSSDNEPDLQTKPASHTRTRRRRKHQRSLSSIVAIAILLTGAGLVLTFTWLSVLFILNPEQVIWLNNFLPAWAQIPPSQGEPPQTLSQIQVNLSQKQQIPGDSLPLDDEGKSFLLPIMRQRPNCEADCREVVELRVYQLENLKYEAQPEKFYRLANNLPISGVEESLTLADDTSAHQDVSNLLPLSEVKRFETKTSAPGVWFYLKGQRQQENQVRNAIAYGQVIYYNRERTNLQPMLSWASPSGHIPKWQQVTGDRTPELIIDQTVALEPQLQVYQVKAVNLYLNPIQLEAISLQPTNWKDPGYENALLIGRSGLWSPAEESLQFIKQQRQGHLPQAVQAQLDLIHLHAQQTKAQAEKTWASPSQQVLAELIDGRWEKALQVFNASPQNAQEIAALLKIDQGRLWRRIVAALKVNPNRQEVQAWGALILTAQQGEAKASAWLNGQPKTTTATLNYIQGLIKQLNPDIATTQDNPEDYSGSNIIESPVTPSEDD
ncbi:hypothetical protein [Nostoc sp. TCL26-01]|uniref:hypothetical protein n=1 Tax=Nostoc sp. TCL26-01 TaxID=2576904 RepID=UPI0015B85DCF|nr:hypothetical protein [Nostoc sp. TCL26-01]